MGVFDPDDFSGRPYEGGLNQMGHFVFGAAILGLSVFSGQSMFTAILFSGSIVIAWEARQLTVSGATLSDYRVDVFYWLSGIVSWAYAIHLGLIVGYGNLLPIVPLCIWVMEFTRISLRQRKDAG